MNLPQLLDLMVQISTQSVLVILTSIQVEPWLVFAFIPALAGLIALRYFSIQAVRQLKRIENEKRSPLLGHVNTTAFGLVTISSFNQQDFFRERLENGTDWTNLIQNKLSHKSHYKKKMKYISHFVSDGNVAILFWMWGKCEVSGHPMKIRLE